MTLIVGCDTNAHHAVRNSADINSRGKELLNYLVTTDSDNLNVDNTPTFRNAIKSSGD